MRNVVVKAGIWLGVLCVVWMLVMGFTGWYKHPTLLNLFYLVIVIEGGVLVWGLRQTAATTGYGGQVGKGTAMAAVGAVVIFFGSLLFTVVLFPNYFEELRTIQGEMLRAQGRTEAEIEAAANLARAFQTPLPNAILGSVMTVLTGLVESLIIAIFVRKK